MDRNGQKNKKKESSRCRIKKKDVTNNRSKRGIVRRIDTNNEKKIGI